MGMRLTAAILAEAIWLDKVFSSPWKRVLLAVDLNIDRTVVFIEINSRIFEA